jgi:hypothetical protein
MAQQKPGDATERQLNKFVNKKSVAIALANWKTWRDVYEHKEKPQHNPVLACPDRFKRFCKEYSVHRTIKRGKSDGFREHLGRSIQKVVRDDQGHALDRFEERCRRKYGTFGGKRKMVSVISKVAAFVRPERFVAWDRYSRAGLNIVLGRAKSTPFKNYAAYLAAIDGVWKEHAEKLVELQARKCRVERSLIAQRAFLRRVFDVALMTCGGRKF